MKKTLKLDTCTYVSRNHAISSRFEPGISFPGPEPVASSFAVETHR